jgi:hypothetical protein
LLASSSLIFSRQANASNVTRCGHPAASELPCSRAETTRTRRVKEKPGDQEAYKKNHNDTGDFAKIAAPGQVVSWNGKPARSGEGSRPMNSGIHEDDSKTLIDIGRAGGVQDSDWGEWVPWAEKYALRISPGQF